ncbi:hypothetical protein PCE1_004081 [Barthelona sp. PCE]
MSSETEEDIDERLLEHNFYLTQHPELEHLMKSYLYNVMAHKPENLYEFSRQFFCRNDLRHVVDLPFEPSDDLFESKQYPAPDYTVCYVRDTVNIIPKRGAAGDAALMAQYIACHRTDLLQDVDLPLLFIHGGGLHWLTMNVPEESFNIGVALNELIAVMDFDCMCVGKPELSLRRDIIIGIMDAVPSVPWLLSNASLSSSVWPVKERAYKRVDLHKGQIHLSMHHNVLPNWGDAGEEALIYDVKLESSAESEKRHLIVFVHFLDEDVLENEAFIKAGVTSLRNDYENIVDRIIMSIQDKIPIGYLDTFVRKTLIISYYSDSTFSVKDVASINSYTQNWFHEINVINRIEQPAEFNGLGIIKPDTKYFIPCNLDTLSISGAKPMLSPDLAPAIRFVVDGGSCVGSEEEIVIHGEMLSTTIRNANLIVDEANIYLPLLPRQIMSAYRSHILGASNEHINFSQNQKRQHAMNNSCILSILLHGPPCGFEVRRVRRALSNLVTIIKKNIRVKQRIAPFPSLLPPITTFEQSVVHCSTAVLKGDCHPVPLMCASMLHGWVASDRAPTIVILSAGRMNGEFPIHRSLTVMDALMLPGSLKSLRVGSTTVARVNQALIEALTPFHRVNVFRRKVQSPDFPVIFPVTFCLNVDEPNRSFLKNSEDNVLELDNRVRVLTDDRFSRFLTNVVWEDNDYNFRRVLLDCFVNFNMGTRLDVSSDPWNRQYIQYQDVLGGDASSIFSSRKK